MRTLFHNKDVVDLSAVKVFVGDNTGGETVTVFPPSPFL